MFGNFFLWQALMSGSFFLWQALIFGNMSMHALMLAALFFGRL